MAQCGHAPTSRRQGVIVASSSTAAAGRAADPAPRATHRAHSPTSVSYCQAHEVSGASRLLFISGQVPADAAGQVPTDFKAQCRLTWSNVITQLRAAGMTLDDLVKVTVFL